MNQNLSGVGSTNRRSHMGNQKKTPKKNAKKNVKTRDLKPKKDVKGGDGPSENISLTYGGIQHRY
jgi:hypothetical protein